MLRIPCVLFFFPVCNSGPKKKIYAKKTWLGLYILASYLLKLIVYLFFNFNPTHPPKEEIHIINKVFSFSSAFFSSKHFWKQKKMNLSKSINTFSKTLGSVTRSQRFMAKAKLHTQTPSATAVAHALKEDFARSNKTKVIDPSFSPYYNTGKSLVTFDYA